jgi:hypothetical protein
MIWKKAFVLQRHIQGIFSGKKKFQQLGNLFFTANGVTWLIFNNGQVEVGSFA